MNKKFAVFSLAFSAFLFCSISYGAGFQLLEQSAAGLGRAFAGGSLAADDASAAFYNPADMLLIKDEDVLQLGASYVNAQSRYKGSYTDPFATTSAVDSKTRTEAVIPHFHYVHSLNDRSAVGLSITAPFGLSTEYSDNWAARYIAISSEIITADINPSYAYKINDEFLIGGGLSAQYAEANLKQAIPGAFFGSATDAMAKVNGDDWSWGYNAGLTWLPNDEQRISLTYRSKVKHELKGDIKVNGLSAPASGLNGSSDGGGDVTLPETITINFWQKLDDRMSAMFSVRHTRWSRYKSLDMNFDNSTWDSSEAQNWRDTLSASFGVDYKYSETIKLRSGFGVDESPIRNNQYRSPRLPATYNTWLSVGASWMLTRKLTLDAAYMLVRGNDSSTNYQSTAGNMSGEYVDAKAQEVGLQLVYRF